MASRIKNRIDDTYFVDVCNRSASMAQAASELKLHFNAFKKRAIELGCYITNQSGKGLKKKCTKKISLSEILEGKHPYYQTFKLKNRLLDEGIFENRCFECEIKEWNNRPLNMELHHVDGDRTNHRKENLELLCPNCHAQTDTYRAKNKVIV